MHVNETCCCGAMLNAGGFSGDKNAILHEAMKFRRAHQVCRDRPKMHVGEMSAEAANTLVDRMSRRYADLGEVRELIRLTTDLNRRLTRLENRSEKR